MMLSLRRFDGLKPVNSTIAAIDDYYSDTFELIPVVIIH